MLQYDGTSYTKTRYSALATLDASGQQYLFQNSVDTSSGEASHSSFLLDKLGSSWENERGEQYRNFASTLFGSSRFNLLANFSDAHTKK